jgi:hypothetical protein
MARQARRLIENVLRTAPVLAWPLDADFNDISGNARNGTGTHSTGVTDPAAGNASSLTADPYEKATSLVSAGRQQITSTYNGTFTGTGFSIFWIMNFSAAGSLDEIFWGNGTNGGEFDVGAASGGNANIRFIRIEPQVII